MIGIVKNRERVATEGSGPAHSVAAVAFKDELALFGWGLETICRRGQSEARLRTQVDRPKVEYDWNTVSEPVSARRVVLMLNLDSKWHKSLEHSTRLRLSGRDRRQTQDCGCQKWFPFEAMDWRYSIYPMFISD